MMTSSNRNNFRVTGPLCREFTGTGEFPTQKPVTRSFDVFFDLRLNKRLSKQSWGWWFETPSWSLWRQCNAMPFVCRCLSQLYWPWFCCYIYMLWWEFLGKICTESLIEKGVTKYFPFRNLVALCFFLGLSQNARLNVPWSDEYQKGNIHAI